MNKELLAKGVKRAFLGIPMMFIGPAVIYNAFQNQDNWVHYIVLAVGICIAFGGAYMLFQGVLIIMKGLFNDKN